MSKYYTPTQDEFYYGFSCEVLDSENEYNPFQYLVHQDQLTDFRVRYLEASDLIDLGFVMQREDNNVKVFIKNVTGERPDYYILHLMYENGLPFVEILNMYNVVLLSRIHIKNVHEIKWILNRYGIL